MDHVDFLLLTTGITCVGVTCVGVTCFPVAAGCWGVGIGRPSPCIGRVISGDRTREVTEPRGIQARSTDLSWITVAEWLCRTSDRRIALRVPGSNAHLRRGAPAANSFRLCGVLQSSAHALGITERCALASSRPTIWRYRRHSDPGWTAPPIRPDMIFGKDSVCIGR